MHGEGRVKEEEGYRKCEKEGRNKNEGRGRGRKE